MADAEEIISKKVVAKNSQVKPVVSKVGRVSETVKNLGRDGTVLMMTSAGGSWVTPSGTKFSKEFPYQFVPTEEIEPLIKTGRFRRADPDEVKDFYNIEL